MERPDPRGGVVALLVLLALSSLVACGDEVDISGGVTVLEEMTAILQTNVDDPDAAGKALASYVATHEPGIRSLKALGADEHLDLEQEEALKSALQAFMKVALTPTLISSPEVRAALEAI